MTAFLGAVHALERKMRAHTEQGISFAFVRFKSTGVIFHEFDLQTYKGRGDYVHSIIGTANPLDKNGQRPSFIEEARAHFTLSLMIEVEGLDLTFRDEFQAAINGLPMQQAPKASLWKPIFGGGGGGGNGRAHSKHQSAPHGCQSQRRLG